MSLSEAIGTQEQFSSTYEFKCDREDVTQSEYYKALMSMRTNRKDTFINDRGSRHIKNRNDKTGVTYAFWLDRDIK